MQGAQMEGIEGFRNSEFSFSLYNQAESGVKSEAECLSDETHSSPQIVDYSFLMRADLG